MWRTAFESALDLLIPPRRTERVVRDLTLEDLQALRVDDALPYHEERVQALVWELKYFANKRAAALAGAVLAEELLALAQDEIGKPLLLPVPMHHARRRERGHNQTELLCAAALKETGPIFAYRPDVLVRTVNTVQQQGLRRQKRLNNIQNSMQVLRPEVVKDRVCIIVDDVTTTGATFAEAKRALREAGAARVHCLALARS